MRFAVAAVEFWTRHGFNTMDWRKSVDGAQALVHDEFARLLVPDLDSRAEVQLYDCPSGEFAALMDSPAWSVPVE